MRALLLRPSQFALVAATLLTVGACQRAEVQPDNSLTGLPGEWRLLAAGGGITGVMSPVQAGQEVVLHFSSDGTYSQQYAAQPPVSGTYQLRREAMRPGQPDTTLVLRLASTSAAGSPQHALFYVSKLNATDLHYTTGGGCALNSNYGRMPAMFCGTR